MFMLQEAALRPFEGRALTLGRQDVWFGREKLEQCAGRAGLEVALPAGGEIPAKRWFADRGFMSDVALMGALGFEDCDALDFSDYEGADIVFDLNEPSPPEELRERFDVIFDLGTLEHVFHLPNALANIHRLLRPNGRIMHVAPSSNHIDHGFYMFSPTFFWDYYTANGWELRPMRLFRHSPRHSTDAWTVYDYRPGDLTDVWYGGLDDRMYGISCIARKTPQATADRVPQQGSYLSAWDTTGETTAPGAGRQRSRLRTLAASAWHSRLGQLARGRLALRISLKRRDLGLKVVDRFR